MGGGEPEIARSELGVIARCFSGIELTDDELDALYERFSRLRTSLAPVRALVGPQDEPCMGRLR